MIKKICVSFSIVLFAVCSMYSQTVTNVRFEQVNKQVKITYTLDKQADISVSVSEDGGITWHAPLKQVSGDVGKKVQPGSKTIYWDVLAEYDQFVGTNICFKVIPTREAEKLTFIVNGVSFTMVYVEGGTFTMGSTSERSEDNEKPAHKVRLNDYYIGQYEVTQALWQVVMGTTVSQQRDKATSPGPLAGLGDIYPMYCINWYDCQRFVNNLNTILFKQLNGKRFALPTEAQWEYAARGGQKSKGYIYAGSNKVKELGWYIDNSNDVTHPVGQKLPNELGLYDMTGNVAEWCQDYFAPYPLTVQTNPIGPASGDFHVYRGGGFNSLLRFCRISSRDYGHTMKSKNRLGMRLVLIP
ncbi:MAG: formylglycine-generating enzyme family protein [Paludibacteraceae bacterium]